MVVISFVIGMNTGMQALLGFCIIASFVVLKTARFAYNTATTKKDIKITLYNLHLAKLCCALFPAIPIVIHLLAIATLNR